MFSCCRNLQWQKIKLYIFFLKTFYFCVINSCQVSSCESMNCTGTIFHRSLYEKMKECKVLKTAVSIKYISVSFLLWKSNSYVHHFVAKMTFWKRIAEFHFDIQVLCLIGSCVEFWYKSRIPQQVYKQSQKKTVRHCFNVTAKTLIKLQLWKTYNINHIPSWYYMLLNPSQPHKTLLTNCICRKRA